MKKRLKFLVAMNNKGKFLGLQESFATTSPFECEHPYDAKKMFPYIINDKMLTPDYWTNIQAPPYYFENSERMRTWLKGYKMVIVEMECEAKILND